MDLIWNNLGLIATILFGLPALHLGWKALKKDYPGQITYIYDTTIPLFHSIAKNLPELNILYRDKPVSKGLVLHKAALVNTGSKDITPKMTEEKITLTLSKGFVWREARLIEHSPKHSCKLKQSEQEIVFEMKTMLRRNEHIRFEAVAERLPEGTSSQDVDTDIVGRFDQALKITHRIADTKPIKQTYMPNEKGIKEFKNEFRKPLYFLGAWTALLFIALMIMPPPEIQYSIQDKDHQTKVSITPRSDGNVLIKGTEDSSFKKIIPIEDFVSYPELRADIGSDRFGTILQYWWLVCAVFLLLFAIALAHMYQRRATRLRKLLAMP